MKRTHCSPSRPALTALLLMSLAGGKQVSASEWEFMVAPLFLWGMSLDGTSAIEGNALPLEMDFRDDIFENMEAAFSLHFEARRDKLTLFAEYQYVSLSPTAEAAIGPAAVSVDVDFDVTMLEAGLAYAISGSESTQWEILGGVRWTDHDLDAAIDGPEILPDRIRGGDDWSHGFLGGRVRTQLSERWSFVGRADYGYGGSDNDALHLNLQVDYRFRDWGSAFFGYRLLDFDYDGGSYVYDVTQQGPLIGLAFYW